jgi:hypothetical protein
MSKQLVLEPERVRELAPGKLKAAAKTVHTALVTADNPAEIVQIGAALDAIEDMMHAAGLYGLDEIVPVNQDRMFARWKLGRVLAKIERKGGPGRGKKMSHDATSFRALLTEWGIDKDGAVRAQRIGALPDKERDAAFKEARENLELLYFDKLITLARPYWYKANRQRRLRAELEPVTSNVASDRTYRTKHGTTSKMKTRNVGKGKRQASLDLDATPPLPPQVSRDIENAWISSALWEIERPSAACAPLFSRSATISSKPRPSLTMASSPPWLRVTCRSGRARRGCSWPSPATRGW